MDLEGTVEGLGTFQMLAVQLFIVVDWNGMVALLATNSPIDVQFAALLYGCLASLW